MRSTLVLWRVEELFKRTAYQLHCVTIRSSSGIEQTLQTTAEHPAYVLGKGWVAAGELKAGDQLQEPDGDIATITAVWSQRYLEGITIYNMRVHEIHTYFVRAEGSAAEPVWVHNAYKNLNSNEAESEFGL